ncbi:DUF1439 domain-containing protein [Pseudomonas sp. HK3]
MQRQVGNLMVNLKLVLCLMFISLNSHGFEQVLKFSEAQLQTRLQEITPISRQTLLANVVLTDGTLQLLEKENEISVTAFLDVTALGSLHGSGSVSVQGSLTYDAKAGAFYLNNAKVTALNVDQLSADSVAQIKPLIQDLVTQSLQSQPIYQLKDNDMRHSLLKASLKRMEVKQKTLFVILGF